MHRLPKIEWDAVAGVLATVTAIVLHFLHVIETECCRWIRRTATSSSP